MNNKMNEDSPISSIDFQTQFEERQIWASLQVTIDDVAKDNIKLVRDLSSYDPRYTVPLLAGLLTVPEYQPNCIRLEILVALAVCYCRGRKKANIGQAVRWFQLIGKSKCVLSEDPAEDVFVSLIIGEKEDFRIIEGVWETAGFYTKLVCDITNSMPKSGRFGRIRRSVRSILKISDIVCDKAGLSRYQMGAEQEHSSLTSRLLPKQNDLMRCVTLTTKELEENDIRLIDIEPFVLDLKALGVVRGETVADSMLDRRPLIFYEKDKVTVTLPSSLSVALRNYIIAEIVSGGMEQVFDAKLAGLYSDLLASTPLLGGPIGVPIHWKEVGGHRVAACNFEIDDGRIASFHFVLPSVNTHSNGGFKNVTQDDGVLTKAIQESIDETIHSFDLKPDFKEGLILTIGCGWGKGFEIKALEVDYSKWRFESIAAADLIRLSWLDGMNPSYFWRIQDGLLAAQAQGVQLLNPNGVVNLIGWVRENDGHYVPHDDFSAGPVSPARPLMLVPPINLIRKVRAASDHGYDRHGATDDTGRRHEVQYISPNPHFESDTSRKLYLSVTDMQSKKWTSVYEGRHNLWLSVEMPNMTKKGVRFRLWEMGSEWLHRIGGVLDEVFSDDIVTGAIRVRLVFYDSELPEPAGELVSSKTLASLCAVRNSGNRSTVDATFSVGFLKGFCNADNVAERLVVRTMLSAYLTMLQKNRSAEEISRYEELVVPNNRARSFHLFQAREFLDYVRHLLPQQLVTVDAIENGIVRLGLAWRVRDQSLENVIRGKDDCTGFLNKVVESLLKEIGVYLRDFNRSQALLRIVNNIEKAHAEDDDWKRTSAAVLGLHGEKAETVEQYIVQASIFAGAGIGSRVLAEMAVCFSPIEGGNKLCEIEFTKLLSKTLLVVQLGGISDAIRYNALTPELTLSPFGDILFKNDFGRLVVEPMLSHVIGTKFLDEAPSQTKNYEAPVITPNAKGAIRAQFWEIWKQEMGFDIDQAREIIGSLEDHAIKRDVLILEMKKSEFIQTVSVGNVDCNAAEAFLKQFSLIPRSTWETVPKGFYAKDIFPWRFGRRLSFVSRPILQSTEDMDPQLIVPPVSLRKGFAYLFDGAYHGRLEQSFFKTKEMRDSWWGQANEGYAFEKKVAQALRDGGWNVRENVGLPEILNDKLDQNFGDIDVLAWRNSSTKILVIECKNLQLARNYSEIASLLSDYQGEEKNGKADKLKKHINRVSVVSKNLEALSRFTKIEDPKVLSCLCFSGTVPMQYTTIEALRDTVVGSISDFLKL